MIYVTCVTKDSTDRIMEYAGVDTYSESPVILSTEVLMDILLDTRIKVVNASIQNNGIEIKKWINGLASRGGKVAKRFKNVFCGPKYVLLGQKKHTYKVVDYYGYITDFGIEAIKKLIKSGDIANCQLVGNDIRTEDVCNIQSDTEFEKGIAVKYTNFIAKAMLLGYGNITFNYTVENSEVRLTKYTGTSTSIILPSFIAAIRKDAFESRGIETLKLNEGLKVIGANAFSFNDLVSIEIPSTVEIIGLDAFSYNRRLFKDPYELSMDRFKLRNNKTVVLNQATLEG